VKTFSLAAEAASDASWSCAVLIWTAGVRTNKSSEYPKLTNPVCFTDVTYAS